MSVRAAAAGNDGEMLFIVAASFVAVGAALVKATAKAERTFNIRLGNSHVNLCGIYFYFVT
ncbi:hypothetical protein [Chromobacterium subtsugae]|nr:hypothetical protein [Chromobacterium subtsugae]